MRHLPTRWLAGALIASSCALLGWAGAASSDAAVVRPDVKPTPTRTTTRPWPTPTLTTPAPTTTTTTPVPTKTTTAPQPTSTKTTTAPAPTSTTTAPRPSASTTTAPQPSRPVGTETSITLSAPSSVVQGEVATLRGTLTAASGSIAGGSVDLVCGTGTPISVPVAITGAFTGFIEISPDQAPGKIFCTATFGGGVGLAGSSKSVPVTVERYRTPTPDPTPSEETPTPTPTQVDPTASATPSPAFASATPVAVGGTSSANATRLLLIVGGATTAVLTVGGMAFTAARGRTRDPDDLDPFIAPDADPITPRRRLAP